MLIRKGHNRWDKGEGVRRWGGVGAWVKRVGKGLGSRGWGKGLAGGCTS